MHSEVTLARNASLTNQNVNWMSEVHLWPTYISLIALFRLLVSVFLGPFVSPEWLWTLTSVAHCGVRPTLAGAAVLCLRTTRAATYEL